MRLVKARVQKYRSIRDSGWFDIEKSKTILVGPNEAGKTVLLQALQQLNPPKGHRAFDPLRDYPRSDYNDITTGAVHPKNVTVVEGHFELEEEDRAAIPEEFKDCTYVVGRRLDNSTWHDLRSSTTLPRLQDLKFDLTRLAAHVKLSAPIPSSEQPPREQPTEELAALIKTWSPITKLDVQQSQALKLWLMKVLPLVEETNSKELTRHSRLLTACELVEKKSAALTRLNERLPVFVLFNNYFRVRPTIHLQHLADRLETKMLDDEQYDYGNQCLLNLLGFSARDLSNLGRATEPRSDDTESLRKYRDQLDKRQYQLNAASVRLTREITSVWQPDPGRGESARLRLVADGQYLKVVVEDDLGVEIELDQRSEGFQWLLSFFVVFFSESAGRYSNSVLLLDEPGLSLHGLKQREFRETVSRLSEKNQTIYTTHSPFLVGPDELHVVRVVEMPDRVVGTKVHSQITSSDSGALLPLQEALGYDLAQTLFSHQRNLILEGLTDYWYLESVSQLLRADGIVELSDKIALIVASSAGKVVYFATILHANKLKVAALLDSDSAGEQAAKQDVLVNTLGNKSILRTKDCYSGSVEGPEIEDLLRETLVQVAYSSLGWDVRAIQLQQPSRPINSIFSDEISGFSKYKLAKSFLKWTQDQSADSLTRAEREQWINLIGVINRVLK